MAPFQGAMALVSAEGNLGTMNNRKKIGIAQSAKEHQPNRDGLV